MSKMFDYITKGGDKVAELEASLEHMGGHLEIELEEADKLRAEIAKLREVLKNALFALDGVAEGDFAPGGQTVRGAIDEARSLLEQQGKDGS